MLKRNSRIRTLVLALGLTTAFAACDDDPTGPIVEPPPTGNETPGVSVLSGTIEAGETVHLVADSTYILRGSVTVDSGAVLRIDPGTTILGDAEVTPTALLVRVGGKIFAEGTAEAPIVFTSSRPEGQRTRGDWAGILIAGDSYCNFEAPCQSEGISTLYGGEDVDDNSGVLSYVRIEFAGYEVSPGNEMNALTLLGAGSGTQIDHIQVHYGSDDGIELFGGTVDIKYAIATGIDDDAFDYSSGWQGRGQFWIAQQAENAGDKGFEVDGNENDFTSTPLTSANVWNVTLVGRGQGSSDGILLRRGYAGSVRNAVVMNFASGAALDLDDEATVAQGCADAAMLDDVIAFGNAELFDADEDLYEAECAGDSIREIDPELADPLDRMDPDFRPVDGSPALTGAASPPSDGFFDAVDFLGGVSPTGTAWYDAWITTATS